MPPAAVTVSFFFSRARNELIPEMGEDICPLLCGLAELLKTYTADDLRKNGIFFLPVPNNPDSSYCLLGNNLISRGDVAQQPLLDVPKEKAPEKGGRFNKDDLLTYSALILARMCCPSATYSKNCPASNIPAPIVAILAAFFRGGMMALSDVARIVPKGVTPFAHLVALAAMNEDATAVGVRPEIFALGGVSVVFTPCHWIDIYHWVSNETTRSAYAP